MTQLEFGHARASDPWTSHAAARSVNVKPSQAAVLRVLDGEMTLADIVDRVELSGERFSDSRIRTATKELQDAGRVIDTGHTVTMPSGRKARLLRRAA